MMKITYLTNAYSQTQKGLHPIERLVAGDVKFDKEKGGVTFASCGRKFFVRFEYIISIELEKEDN